jgi:hypothetical protein
MKIPAAALATAFGGGIVLGLVLQIGNTKLRPVLLVPRRPPFLWLRLAHALVLADRLGRNSRHPQTKETSTQRWHPASTP